MTMDTDRRLTRLGQVNLRLSGHITEAVRAELLEERDGIIADLLAELAELHRAELEARIAWNETLLARDGMVRDLMNAKVSASAVAYAIESDRTWPYTVASTYADRLAKWRAKHPATG